MKVAKHSRGQGRTAAQWTRSGFRGAGATQVQLLTTLPATPLKLVSFDFLMANGECMLT